MKSHFLQAAVGATTASLAIELRWRELNFNSRHIERASHRRSSGAFPHLSVFLKLKVSPSTSERLGS